jgi:hypothetical protein
MAMQFFPNKSCGGKMKKIIVAAILSTSILSGGALAGSLADPILEEDLIEAAVASDGGLLVPLIFLIIALPAIGS